VNKPYRKNVGIVVFNAHGEVLVGERLTFIGAWQFPQGGVDEGEELEFAARRELYEEVGIKDAVLVYEHPDWVNYDFPPELNIPQMRKYRGQTQKWFLYYWNQSAENCNLEVHEREFNSVRFIPLKETLKHIVPFKLEVYKTIVASFDPQIKNFLSKIASH
jgi:putative (di)nucleoside polyphosphate hydrolase